MLKSIVNNIFKVVFKFSQMFFIIGFSVSSIFSSDLSDASALRERCEKEITALEVSVKNFGDNTDNEEFKKGEQLVKLGKVKYIQTKYTDAIENYNNYLKLQFNIYEILVKKYLERSEKLIDGVAEDLVDFVNNKKVVEYLRLANQNLKNAKGALATKHYKKIIDVCRTAKNYATSAYKLAGKDIPEQYKLDAVDNEGKIFKK